MKPYNDNTKTSILQEEKMKKTIIDDIAENTRKELLKVAEKLSIGDEDQKLGKQTRNRLLKKARSIITQKDNTKLHSRIFAKNAIINHQEKLKLEKKQESDPIPNLKERMISQENDPHMKEILENIDFYGCIYQHETDCDRHLNKMMTYLKIENDRDTLLKKAKIIANSKYETDLEYNASEAIRYNKANDTIKSNGSLYLMLSDTFYNYETQYIRFDTSDSELEPMEYGTKTNIIQGMIIQNDEKI